MEDVYVERILFVVALIGLTLLLSLLPRSARGESNVTLIPASGPAGSQASLVGRAFGRHDRVTVRVGRRIVARTRTSRRGKFRASFTVFQRRSGRLRIVSRSGGRRTVNLFRLSAPSAGASVGEIATRTGREVRWTPTDAPVGSAVELSGSRFPARRLLRIRLGGREVGRARTNRHGRFSTGLTVPPLAAGRHLIRIKLRSRALGFLLSTTYAPTAASQAPPAVAPAVTGPDAVIAAAGDIACAPGDSSSSGKCHEAKTADLVLSSGAMAVLPLGDLQYNTASLSNLRASYDRSWGRFRSITRPALGNHESSGSGYFDYFNGVGVGDGPAGQRGNGYYSYNLGSWHLIALNSNCGRVPCNSGSAQEQWLRGDLAANASTCTLAYWHHPRFSSGYDGDGTFMQDIWKDLYDANADLVLVGHSHDYERFAPVNVNGGLDRNRGIREFVVGTGGAFFTGVSGARPNSEVRQNNTFGVLKLVLHPRSYDWQFLPEQGRTFSDAGSQACH
jgi:calcineurin-like phosphoesterase family protein